MNSSFQSLLQAIVLLTLLLAPGKLVAQSQASATAPSSRVPDLAEIIPLATAVSERLASLERAGAEGVDLSRVEKQLAAISARVDEYAGQFLALRTATDARADRLPQLKAALKSAGGALAGINTLVTDKVRTLGNLRKEWLAEQQWWHAWQAAVLHEEPLEPITTTVTRTQGTIETALGLLRQQLRPLLAIQEHAGTLHTRITTLTAEVGGLIALSQGGTVADASPAMFSAQYLAQLAAAFSTGVHTGLVQIAWPDTSFLARQGWILVLQGVLALLLALVFVHYRPRLEHVEHWRFLAGRPLAAGLLVGILSVVFFYESPPDIVRLALSVLVGMAFVRLLEGLVEEGWRRQFVYGLVLLSILTNLVYVLGMPLALFRLYILVAALVSLFCCLRWAAASRRLQEARLYAWVLRLAAVVLAVVLGAEIWGEATLAEFLFVSVLRTLGTVLVFGLLRHLVRGGLEWATRRAVSRHPTLLGPNTALVVLGVDLTKMTLLVSALSIGIGFGLQTIVNNFVCGLILLLERPLQVGDTVDLGGLPAKITKIGLRSTMVRTADQADVIVPNTELITNRVTNWTLTDRQARSVIPVGVAYGSDIQLVMQTLRECALAHPRVLHSPEPQVLFRSFGDSSLDFELRAWVADVDTRLQVASDLHQDIDRRFRQAGIEIPFPQRDLHVRSVEHMNTMAAIVKAPLD